ncbi:hypothetical protein [Undibacterium sp.]|uniref:hypothetical protein n=1 Tax=Undibacterium sp. TaxID=1914977 RepID=UPI0027303E97|nr:hypothetical protein [Undibacterium sp.]MDP1977236.1 hypothetical protein [Undibacterium sp.]
MANFQRIFGEDGLPYLIDTSGERENESYSPWSNGNDDLQLRSEPPPFSRGMDFGYGQDMARFREFQPSRTESIGVISNPGELAKSDFLRSEKNAYPERNFDGAFPVRGRDDVAALFKKDYGYTAGANEMIQYVNLNRLPIPPELEQEIFDRDQTRLSMRNAKNNPSISSSTTSQTQENPADFVLSGPTWVSRFPTSRSLDDLHPQFKSSMNRFVEAIRSGGGDINVDATYRPSERAYLMHYAHKIASGQINPEDVPPMAGVPVQWVHPVPSDSVNAARQMKQAYGIVYPPALVSRHTARGAVDMRVTGLLGRTVADANGNSVRIDKESDLYPVGASYGVRKLVSDKPHWSDDGN